MKHRFAHILMRNLHLLQDIVLTLQRDGPKSSPAAHR